MPYRKYTSKKGKHGPIYNIVNGITVCRNEKGKWIIKINRGGDRTNKTIGLGRNSLIKAIQVAESISGKITAPKATAGDKPQRKSSVPKFDDYSASWLKSTSGRVSATTVERYEGILRIHILPDESFASKRLDEIKRKDVKKLLIKVRNKRSPATVEITQTVIHSIFEDAIDDEIISGNPARLILKKILPAKRKRRLSEPQPLTREDAVLFLEQVAKICPKPIALIIKVMLFGGLRIGEAIALRADFLDFSKRAYCVKESFKRGDFSKPKSGNSRWVDLPDFLLQELKQYIISIKKENLKSGLPVNISLLFPDPDEHGLPYSQRKLQATLKRVCTKAGIGMRSPHDLRHTYASWLLMGHYSPVYVQKQLGHSSIEITVGTYGHWIDGEGRPDLEKALQPAQNPEQKCISLHIAKEKGL